MIAKCRFRIVDVGEEGLGAKLCAAYPSAEVASSFATGSRYEFAWSDVETPALPPRLGDFLELTAVDDLRRVRWAPDEQSRGDQKRFEALLASVDEWGAHGEGESPAR